MSQQDCLDFLNEQKEINPDKWFRVKDIQEALQERGKGNGTLKNVWSHLMKLSACNDISWRGVGGWHHYKEFKGK